MTSIQKNEIKNEIWFIDVPKTSSFSIRNKLATKYGGVFGKKAHNYSYSPHFPAEKIKALSGKTFGSN